jgi:general secretion pathway protein K
MELLFSTFGNRQLIPKDAGHIDYDFPSGVTHVEIIPEASKMDVNKASPESLFRLLTALGVDGGRAGVIASAIVDWRAPSNGGGAFDGYYLSRVPSFQSPHASFEEIEELLAVRGVTPDIFYGTWAPAAANGDPAVSPLVRHAGLIDCLTVYGGLGNFQSGTAEPAVLAALGTAPDVIQGIAMQRANGVNSSDSSRIMMQGNAVFTFRSTARLKMPNGKFSDMRRTVGATVKYVTQPAEVPYHVLRWYDTAWSN